MKRLFLFLFLALLATLPLAAQTAQVSLVWDPNPAADQVSKYSVYEKISGTFVKLMDISPTVCTSTDCTALLTAVSPGIHTYAVTATNQWGESAKSNEATSPGPAGIPLNLKIVIKVIIGGQ